MSLDRWTFRRPWQYWNRKKKFYRSPDATGPTTYEETGVGGCVCGGSCSPSIVCPCSGGCVCGSTCSPSIVPPCSGGAVCGESCLPTIACTASGGAVSGGSAAVLYIFDAVGLGGSVGGSTCSPVIIPLCSGGGVCGGSGGLVCVFDSTWTGGGVCGGVGVVPGGGFLTDFTWINNTSGTWWDSANWHGGQVPNDTSDVFFNENGVGICLIDDDAECLTLTAEDGFTGAVSLQSYILRVGDYFDWQGQEIVFETGIAIFSGNVTLAPITPYTALSATIKIAGDTDAAINFNDNAVENVVIDYTSDNYTKTFTGSFSCLSFEHRDGKIDTNGKTIETTGDFSIKPGAEVVSSGLRGTEIIVGGNCFLHGTPAKKLALNPRDYSLPKLLGSINFGTEISGLAYSQANANVLFCVEDSGADGVFHAINTAGELLRTYNIMYDVGHPLEGTQVDNIDFEEIRCADGYIYVCDIGDNTLDRDGTTRPLPVLYRILEPTIASDHTTPDTVDVTCEVVELVYDDSTQHNAEACFVDPYYGDMWLFTKRGDGSTFIFKCTANSLFGVIDEDTGIVTATMVKQSEWSSFSWLNLNGISAADISSDGLRIALRTSAAGNLGDPDWYHHCKVYRRDEGQDILEAITQPTYAPTLIAEDDEPQGESLTFRKGTYSLYTTGEAATAPLYMYQRGWTLSVVGAAEAYYCTYADSDAGGGSTVQAYKSIEQLR